jgi:hypothetical protein
LFLSGIFLFIKKRPRKGSVFQSLEYPNTAL